MSAARLAAEQLGHMTRRCVLEAVEAATASFWLRRAAALEAARPVPGDFTGHATRDDLSRRWRELTQAAAACRARAAVTHHDAELATIYDEVIAS